MIPHDHFPGTCSYLQNFPILHTGVEKPIEWNKFEPGSQEQPLDLTLLFFAPVI